MSFRAKGGICFSVVALGGAVHLNEHDCLVLIHQDTIFQMPAHGAREHDLLQVTPFAHHFLNTVALGDPHGILLDDGPFVQGGGGMIADIMTMSPSSSPVLYR